ncbi:hypothetical protein Ddc_16888 [Ditylenchus destructor]|nr:hypothetical protein Ddc_16888 [Ditylenchus destructor]
MLPNAGRLPPQLGDKISCAKQRLPLSSQRRRRGFAWKSLVGPALGSAHSAEAPPRALRLVQIATLCSRWTDLTQEGRAGPKFT